MKYVTCFGGIWQMTNTKYYRYLKRVAAEEDPSLDDFGKFLGEVLPATDITAEEAQNELDIDTAARLEK